ncbi:hypothetical protein BG004_007318 [Podila humilis]|nr:hypothetical protein BG004_007318 [Podila humilis]
MDTDHSRPSALPTKLRWRPYSNGTSIKSKKVKKEAQLEQERSATTQKKLGQDINPKVLAHKVRGGKPHYVGKNEHPSNAVQLQWEEAETMESMSIGGHPHNQHPPPHYLDPHQHHHEQQPNTTATRQHAKDGSSTLPSPPLTRLALVGGESDLSQYKASLSALSGTNTRPQDASMSLSSILGNSSKNHAYHLALTALLENHRSQMRLSQVATPSLSSSSADSASQPSSPGADSGRRLSSSELLDISTIDELLESCGYADGSPASTTTFLASPATTNQSLHSSPETTLLGTPSQISASGTIHPSVLSTTAAVHQDPGAPLFTQSDLVQDLSSPFAYLSSNRDPLLNNAPSAWPSLFPLEGSNFGSMDSKAQTRIPMVTTTTTNTQSQPESSHSSDHEYLSPPTSGISGQSSPMSSLGLGDGESDTEWFGYLNESSPLFTDAEGINPSGPMFDQNAQFAASDLQGSNGTPTTPSNTGIDSEGANKTIWNWAEEMMRPTVLSPTGHRHFPGTGPMARSTLATPFGGNGGLVRSLQSNYQQKSGYHTKAGAPRVTSGPTGKSGNGSGSSSNQSTTSAASIVAAAVRGKPVKSKRNSALKNETPVVNKKQEMSQMEKEVGGGSKSKTARLQGAAASVKEDVNKDNKTVAVDVSSALKNEAKDPESYRGLLAMFRGLWQGNDGSKGSERS